ncbi:tyrosine-type recombinase/integrase [Primorskyibacter sp. S187A]|uniref:tyrosine-type recombinase/integrase n=1 Tax=Primorskyibacter sp. S187A TaxID=3415130 RepID=UPI003C7ADA0E
MSLSATQVKNIKPGPKPVKLSDGGGLYLLVNPKGSKLWRMNYRHLGRQKTASFGPFPSVTLAEARERREEAKRVLRAGQDPVEHSNAVKEASAKALAAQENVTKRTFEALSLSFIAKRTREKASFKTLQKYDWLHRLILTEIGHMDPMEIEPPHLRNLLLRLEAENKLDTAHRARAYVGQVMRHGIAAGLATRDPSPDLRGLVASPRPKNHAAIKAP